MIDKIKSEQAKLEFVNFIKQDFFNPEYLETLHPWIKDYIAADFDKNPITGYDFEPLYRYMAISKMNEVLIECNYLDVLANKSEQLCFIDEYGDWNCEAFDLEVTKFVKRNFKKIKELYRLKVDIRYRRFARDHGNSKVKFYVPSNCSSNEKTAGNSLCYLIKMCAFSKNDYDNKLMQKNVDDSEQNCATLDDSATGYEYEEYVLKLLTRNGWEAICTKKSGDQGGDILANKMNIKIIVQCKKYSKPVGNKAVQEVHAAKSFYKANKAIVITNHSFTKQARQLAQNLHVTLINDADIINLDKILNIEIL